MSQLFNTPPAIEIALPEASLTYYPKVDLGVSADQLFEELNAQIAWRQEHIRLFGREVLQPRLLAWYGEPEATYRYSGVSHTPLPWLPTLAGLRHRLEAQLGQSFNSVLANLYRDGADSMGLHADDEPELGDEPVIASLSLGGERTFKFRSKHDKQAKPLSITLEHGSLLVMSGATQKNYKHELPKTRRPVEPRINLTYRKIFSRTSDQC